MDTTLVKAAGIRALRTFLQGLVGFGATALGAAALGDAAAQAALVTAVVGAASTAVVSFINGIISGLPEVGGE